MMGQMVNHTTIESMMLNTSKNRPAETLAYGVTFATTAALSGVLGLVGNIIILAIILRKRKSRNSQGITHCFMASLAVSDLLVCTAFVPSFVASVSFGQWSLGHTACEVLGFVTDVTFIMQFLNMMLIALNRFCCIVHYKHYRDMYSSGRIAIMIGSMWLVAIAQRVPVVAGIGHMWYDPKYHVCFHIAHHKVFSVLFRVCVAMPMVITAACYIAILVKVQRTRKAIKEQRHNKKTAKKFNLITKLSKKKKSLRPKRVEVKLALQFFIIYFAFLLVSIPYLTLSIPSVYLRASLPWFLLVVTATIINSSINPPIYIYFNLSFRQELRQMFACISEQPSIVVNSPSSSQPPPALVNYDPLLPGADTNGTCSTAITTCGTTTSTSNGCIGGGGTTVNNNGPSPPHGPRITKARASLLHPITSSDLTTSSNNSSASSY